MYQQLFFTQPSEFAFFFQILFPWVVRNGQIEEGVSDAKPHALHKCQQYASLGMKTLTVTTKLLRAATLTSLCRPILSAAIGTCKARPSTEIFSHPTRTHSYTEYSQFLTSRCLNFSISETAAIWDPFRPFFMRTGEREGVCLQVSHGCSFPCWKENLESLSMSLSSHLLSFMTLDDSGTCSNAPQATHKINPWRSEATSGEA